MKKQFSTLYVFDNVGVNYVIMYHDNVEKNFVVKNFVYEWSPELEENFKVLDYEERFAALNEAFIKYSMIVCNHLIITKQKEDKIKYVYVICSLVQEETLIYNDKEEANKRINSNDILKIFDKSKKEDLYISERVLF